jgi:hypothetical protein
MKVVEPTLKFTFDTIHPSYVGHALISYSFLKAMGCTEQASGLVIDTVNKTSQTINCIVQNLNITTSSITFTRTDNSLPNYFEPECKKLYARIVAHPMQKA